MTGCSALDVNNPSVIEDESLNNTTGANYLLNTARWHFADAVSSISLASGLLADEFLIDFDLTRRDITELSLDRRESVAAEPYYKAYYVNSQLARRDADIAMARVRSYAAPSVREAQVGELFALRGFAALQLAETVCPGLPLHRVVNFEPVYGDPLTTEEALTQAVTEFDSALVYTTDSVSLQSFARLGKARALLGLGEYAEAGAVAALVPSGYTRSVISPNNALYDGMHGEFWLMGVSDQEGGNGLDFVSANDPRVRVTPTRYPVFGDTSIILVASDKYPEQVSPIVVASGVEARLIEAEAALQANGPWLSILNDLRTDGTFTTQPNAGNPAVTDTLWNAGTGGVAGLRPLSAPSGTAAQVDLLFRERAFWLFATGRRLGDLRRLIRLYSHDAESIFPRGSYRNSSIPYGTATSLPFDGTSEHNFNPANVGCTSR
jgi:hypothetical protein